MKPRLVAFYQKYAPDKLNNVDNVMATYEGREEELFAFLVKRYGPEPKPSEAAQQPQKGTPKSQKEPPAGSPEVMRKRLIEFYTMYSPDKLKNVDNVVATYEGREEELFRILKMRYAAKSPVAFLSKSRTKQPSPVPPSTPPKAADDKKAPRDSTASPAKSSVPDGPAPAPRSTPTKEQRSSTDDVASSFLSPRSLSALATNASSMQHRLTRFFHYYEPSQLPLVPQWLENWRGREDEMMRNLIQFHGPEPSNGMLSVPPQSKSSTVRSVQMSLRDRCIALMQQFCLLYCPERFPVADVLVDQWKGRENNLFERLEHQAHNRDTIFGFFLKYFPERLEEVPSLLREWFGREHELLLRLEDSLPESLPQRRSSVSSRLICSGDLNLPDPSVVWRHRFLELFRAHDPERTSEVDMLVSACRGNEENFRKAYDKLRSTYVASKGPADGATLSSPPHVVDQVAPSTAVEPIKPSASGPMGSLNTALEPPKCADATLSASRGSEADLVQSLVSLRDHSPAAILPVTSYNTQRESFDSGEKWTQAVPRRSDDTPPVTIERTLWPSPTRTPTAATTSSGWLPLREELPRYQYVFENANSPRQQKAEANHSLSLWLGSFSLEHLYPTFLENDVDMVALRGLTHADFDKLKISETDQQQLLMALSFMD